jgi:hypothetical protein
MVNTNGRMVKNHWYYWLCYQKASDEMAVGSMVRWITELPLSAG